MIRLGDKVRCRITGFEGIATGRAEYLNGCVQISVMAPHEKGEMPQHWIDEPYLSTIAGLSVSIDRTSVSSPGGPVAFPPPKR